jgi:hypothetical protein
MSDETMGSECGDVREMIPDVVGAAASAEGRERFDAQVRQCPDCRAELELARIIYSSRAAAPHALLERIQHAAREDRRAPARTWWGVSAAAIAALALGIAITSDPAPGASGDVPGYASEAEEGEIWLSDDGLLAGAPALGDLSDEALLQLLDELSTGLGGGTA